MQNCIGLGDLVNITSPAAGTTSGEFVLTGLLGGVAVDDSSVGDTIAVQTTGIFTFPKTAGAGTAFAVGDAAKWDVSASAFDATAAAAGVDAKVGVVVVAAADGDTEVTVMLTNPAVLL